MHPRWTEELGDKVFLTEEEAASLELLVQNEDRVLPVAAT